MLRRVLVTLLFATTTIAAELPDLHWRLLGPFRGGRVLAVTGVPGEAEHFYFGSVNGGVWETRDAGRTWQPLFDAQPVQSIGAMAVAPSNPNVLYVGTGEADMRSDIAQGEGIFKSVDAGKTWTRVGLEDTQQIGRVIVHPENPDIAFVAALGHPYAANAQRGVYRTKDGGKTWQRVLSRNDSDTGAIDVQFEPGNPNVLYAALWQTRRTPWSVYPPSNGAGTGLFKSTDGGEHWTEIKDGLPAKPGRMGIGVCPSMPKRVYLIVDADEGGGMYRSDDAGATWTKTSRDQRIWSRGWYFGGITVEPDNADVVYSVNINLYRSADGGKTFAPVKGAPGGDDYHQLWIDPQHPNRRILGVDQGTVVSVNGGKTWSSWYNQPTGQFYHVSTDNRFPYWVYGAQQDSGAAGIPSRTNTYDGITMEQFRELTSGGESDNIAPDPKDPEVIYGGRVTKLDTRTGQTRSLDPNLAHPSIDRRTWTLPLVFSHRDPKVLYFSNQRLFRTEDGGEHWTVISPDLTREDPGTPANLDPATAALRPGPGSRFGVIYAIAPSRVADKDIWVGTDDGQIWRTRDEGGHWTNVTPPALTPWSKVGIIETSHFDADTAYAAVDRHRLDDFKPYVYKTHDGGKTWTLIANGLPTFVNAVREDSVKRGLLYAATERGMSVSFDDGAHWESLQLNLPATSVRDIDVHGNDVVIATHGRAFWALDDVTPLRQSVPATGDFLFAPATAVRERPAGFTGTPMPKDEALAPNPPMGAYVDYLLRSTPAQAVTLDITDANGTLVRRYSSADAAPQADPAKLRTAPEWLSTPSTLKATPGLHRFVWPLRYPAATGGAYSSGVWAPPGTYKLTLTVDGKTYSQPLTVAPDPRLNLPMSMYAEEFALAREVEALQARVAKALEEAEGRVAKLTGPERERALELSGIVASGNAANNWWVPPTSTASLRYLEGALGRLLDAVDDADGGPSPDAKKAWEWMKPAAEKTLGEWALKK